MSLAEDRRDADARPYGVDPRRSRTPLRVLLVVYGVWLAILAWMALQQHHRA